MPHAKFQDHQTFVSEDEDFNGFYHIWAGWPSWPCDPYTPNKRSFPCPMDGPLIGQVVLEKVFENNGHIICM